MPSPSHLRAVLFGLALLGLCPLREALAAPPQSSFFDASVTDPQRGRVIPYRTYVPANASGPTALILVSHGSMGSALGYTRLEHLGEHYASEGYLAIHVGHLESFPSSQHRFDRPRDVSHLLDLAELGSLPLPASFTGTIDFSRIGHIGHSWGAYTAHALGGVEFDHGNFRDARIRAIATLSPQGPGGFGAYDRGPSDNSWANIAVPVYALYGELESDFNVSRTIQMAGWRGYPFSRYGNQVESFLSILPGTDHSQLGIFGSPQVEAFIAVNTRLFFDAMVRDDLSVVCEIGRAAPLPDVVDVRRYDPLTSAAAGCCGPPSGTRSFASVADATIDEGSPDLVDGSSSTLRLQVGGAGSSRSAALLQFDLRDLQGEVTSAVLRMSPLLQAPGLVAVYATTTEGYESTYTWNESPAALEALDTVQAGRSTLEWDVTDLIHGVGVFGFRLEALGAAGEAYTFPSRESGSPPELIVSTLAVPVGSPQPTPCDLPVGRSFCAGDGDAATPTCTPCPCGNDAPSGSSGGCLNAQGRSAVLQASGEPRTDADSLRFGLRGGSPNNFALLYSAENILPGSSSDPCQEAESGVFSAVFDGLRCIGGSLLRHGTRATDANGDVGLVTNGWGPNSGGTGTLLVSNGFLAGQVRRFQVVYRSDVHGACSSGQNTTQGLELTFRP